MPQNAIQVNIINKSTNELPAYATAGSSGLDIRAYINEEIILAPLERQLIPTGIYLSIPTGYEIQVRPRSGLAVKNGLTCLNSPGTIDSDYRGELKVLLINLSNSSQKIVNGDRIAQLVLQKVESLEWQLVNDLDITQRNDGGFGHSGVQ
jgi:dUTP pyrophosphatase